MQNPHVKYLKTKNGKYYLFYHEYDKIYLRGYGEAGWSAPQILTEKAAPVFSICQYGDACHMLYSTLEGQLFLGFSTDFSNWEHRPLMGGAPNAGKTKFFMLPDEDSFHIIYHLPTEATGVESLVYAAFRNGKWEKPYQIDRFMPFGRIPFLARRLSKEHIILYYRTARNTWSAREMLLSPYTMGSLTPLIQTPSNCIDLSIINDAERIHVLYIVRGMFRTQVVYQYKQTTAISTPRVLWEDANCDNCLAYLEHGKLMVMWTISGQPMRCVSENNGATFGPAERYTGSFPIQCIKGELIGAEDAAFYASETYGDATHGFIPILFSPPVAPAEPQRKPVPEVDHEKVFSALQENHKKQLEELSTLLAQRSDEISAVNARWKGQVDRLERELQSLRQEKQPQSIAPPQNEDI